MLNDPMDCSGPPMSWRVLLDASLINSKPPSGGFFLGLLGGASRARVTLCFAIQILRILNIAAIALCAIGQLRKLEQNAERKLDHPFGRR